MSRLEIHTYSDDIVEYTLPDGTRASSEPTGRFQASTANGDDLTIDVEYTTRGGWRIRIDGLASAECMGEVAP